jgi:hypothetical protein
VCWGPVIVIRCCEKAVAEAGTVREPRGRGKSAVGSRYQNTYSKTCLKRNLKGPEHFFAEARCPFNKGILR